MPTDAQKRKWATEDARNLEAVRVFYETGDEALLSPVLANLRPRLVSFLKKKRVYDADLRDDLVQDSLTKILLGLRRRLFTGQGKLFSWAVEICWITYADFLERGQDKASRPGSLEDPFLLLGEKVAIPADGLAENGEEGARAIALIKGATQVVLGLDINARNVLLSYFYHGQDRIEACARLGINAGRYVGRLKRGLAALREWGAKQQVPTDELYASLSQIDTGNLFKERPLHHLSHRAKKAARQRDGDERFKS